MVASDGIRIASAAGWMTLVLQFLRRHLHDGDASMRELVDELRPTRTRYLCGLRLRKLAVRVPERSRRDAHLLHELGRRQPQCRERPFRHVERYRGHYLGL